MREIIFKAKRKDNGEWVEVLLTVMWGQYHIINPNDENTAYPIDEKTICQYTGLTDKNGRKIWENDIFKHYNRVNFDDKESYVLGVTVWDEKHCRFTNKDWIQNDIYVLNRKCVYEVIGNVFDNPELLEKAR